jgi:hypothetical protein
VRTLLLHLPEGTPRTVARTAWYLLLTWAILACWDAPPWDISYDDM